MGAKKRIAVVAIDVRLPGEKRGLDREPYIAQRLVEAGYEVDLITSAFQHWDKSQRDLSDPMYAGFPYRVVFIEAPAYKRNITPARISNHAQVAKKVARHFESHAYDLVFVRIPPNDLARVCAEYTLRAGIPLVADVNDLWPEAMRMVLDVPVVSSVLFSPFKRDADFVYRHASAVVGTSDEYAERALQSGASPRLLTVYVGNDVAEFDEEVRANPLEKPAGESWATYAGTIGTSYDIETLVRAGRVLKDMGRTDIKLMVLGAGPELERVQGLAAQLKVNAVFPGYLPHAEMAAYLAASDVLVNSFARKAPQSIVSKVGDYLAAGKPMVNTLANPKFMQKVEHDGFGVNVEPENPVELAAALVELIDNPSARERMGAAARHISEEQFDRPRAYAAVVDLIDSFF